MDPTSARARDGQDTWDAHDVEAPGPSPDLETRTLPTSVAVPARLAAERRASAAAVDAAMRAREAAAMRGFVKLVAVLVVAVLVAVPMLHAGAGHRVMLGSGLTIALGGAIRTWLLLRRGPLGDRDTFVFGLTCLVGATAGVWFFGFFSPASTVTIMGIFFFGMQRSLAVALLLYLGTAVSHGACMVAITFGAIADPGVVSGDGIPVRNRLVMIGLIQLVYVMVFLLARAVHHAIVQAAVKLEQTTRGVAQREALLDEARRELERALEVGGPGRFTEQRLGPWELGVLCGRGAMGDVYEATHAEAGTRAAVKLLTRRVLSDGDQVRRFLREARIASSIDVVNVVQVLDVANEDAPVPYLAMELLRGTDLAALLRRRRTLGADEVVALLRQVGHGLDAAHAAGVVHRDLKPQNLFFADGPTGSVWKILDFGVSRLVDVDSSLTRGQAIGTPSYMSPEQARGEVVDKRTDLFALGVLAYRALTGRPAFTGREVPQILYRVVHATPPRPSDVADLPAAVDDVLAIALAKRPADRFQTAAALAEAMEAALAGEVDPALAARAARIVAAAPWDAEVRPAPAAAAVAK